MTGIFENISSNNLVKMTQIKQEPCDYDETDESQKVATCIEIKDPLDIKLEPVLIKSEPVLIKSEPVLDIDEKEESESESIEKQVISEPQNGTADVDLDNIDLILSDQEENGKSDDEKNVEEFSSDNKNEDLSEEDEDFSIPDVESPEEPETDEDLDVDVEGFDEIPPEDDPMDLNGSDGSEENETIEIEGLEIVQKGQYSKCPRCEKFIKSTFIIRLLEVF